MRNATLAPLDIKPARHGSAEIVVDTPSAFDRLSGSMRGMPLHRKQYTRLIVNGGTMMTDAEFETAAQ